uniref:Uncharacterized protein AlNc14C3G388 n=1 Tax=Albugo laibachii Nc14 TaxID=890382 RepID=F0VZQ9_9STRA|nr:conserved hypothetical protein [Albugo laibachii Nc14]|eukprot:CCA14280.1 conserved hypothetical protein [Albugo laibachii Nc14]
MTGKAAQNVEVDYFYLDNRRKKHIDVCMLDYDYISKCMDLDELKGILSMLKSGKEGRYPHLEEFTETKILSVLPVDERNRIIQMKCEPSELQVQEEVDGLTSWVEKMHTKCKLLDAKKPSNLRPRYVPPVRNSEPKVEFPQDHTNLRDERSTTGRAHERAIHASDFRSWQCYDVEEALKEIDEDDLYRKDRAEKKQEVLRQREEDRKKQLASLPAYIKIRDLTVEERKIYADEEKQKGNEYYKVGEMENSLLYYNRSLTFDSSSAIVHANRAMVHLRLKRFASAEDDCSCAINLDPAYVKGWMRRGIARFQRGKYIGAIDDFAEALRLDPSNKGVEKLLAKTQAKLREVGGSADEKRNCPNSEGCLMKEETKRMDHPDIDSGENKATKFKRFEILDE